MTETREEMKARLRAQEAWGKWNTAPLANKIYGKPWKGWDYIALAAGFGLPALKLYWIWSMFQ